MFEVVMPYANPFLSPCPTTAQYFNTNYGKLVALGRIIKTSFTLTQIQIRKTQLLTPITAIELVSRLLLEKKKTKKRDI